MARAIDADAFREWWLENGENEYVYDTNAFLDSIDNWPTLTPPNEPLTCEELREMDGEPVWVKCLKPSQYTDPPERWRILEKSITGHFGVWNGDCALIERNYGTDWLAYRRPPEGAG